MKGCIKRKDPEAKLDYGFKWEDWLDGDTLNGSTWTVPDGLIEVSNNYTNTITTIWLSGGVSGAVYKVVNSITTAGGRKDDRTLTVIMRNK